MSSAYILGGGRLGSALARGLGQAGWRVLGHSRSAAGRARLKRLGARLTPAAGCGEAGLVFLAVPDDAIAGALAPLAAHLRRGQVVAHGSGAVGLAPLAPARRRGAHPGSLHVLQALTFGPFARGVTAALDGDAAALRLLRRAARDLGLAPVRVPASGRALYHASAVLSANLVMALADLAREAWVRSGAPPGRALPALVPLMRGAVENLARVGLPRAVTGPVARGDAGVVERQLAALGGDPREVYRLLSRRLLDLVGPQLDPAAAKRLRRALYR